MSMDDYIAPPRVGKSQRIAVSATPDNTALGSHVVGKGYVRVKAEGTDVQCFFTQSGSDAIVADSVTTATTGPTIKAGTYEDFELSGVDDRICHVGAAAGFLTITRAGRDQTRG